MHPGIGIICKKKVEGKRFLLIPNMLEVFQGDVMIIYAKSSVKWAALASGRKELVLASIKFFAFVATDLQR